MVRVWGSRKQEVALADERPGPHASCHAGNFMAAAALLRHVEFGRVGVAAGENGAACFQDLSTLQQSGELMLAYGGHIPRGNPGSGGRIVEFGAALDIAARRAAKILRALSSCDQNLVI